MTYRKSLNATFGIIFSKHFLPLQLIYGGKTTRSIPKIKLFPLSDNDKHFRNTIKVSN